MPAWQAGYFGMVTGSFSDCARSVLRQSVLRGYWASADTLTLPAGTQLLRLPFLECWHAGISSPKYGKLSGSRQIVITRKNRAKLRLCYLQNPSLSRIVVYIRNPWGAHHPHQPGLPVLLLLIARIRVRGPFPSRSVPNLPCVSTRHPAAHSSSPPFL